ncbi:MAG: arginine--tRNA ligase [Bacteroidales bacterium]|nr:arginine--tRNA ligase [Bacteroidales bacterium]MDY6170107.1 arginine--tRNA ligase [Candidatus Cryptobacteroides sp.]
MIQPDKIVAQAAANAIHKLWETEVDSSAVQVQITRKEFEGDYTVVVFPFVKTSRQAPEATGAAMGEWIVANVPEISAFNCVKGFLNLSLSNEYWNSVLAEMVQTPDFGQLPETGRTVMVEFSSPNTNKPLHLGHIRNNLLGWSVSRLLEANGHRVIKANLVNDRGIHICKSMLAWLKTCNGATPESLGVKGDHLVGDCYVKFNDLYKAEVEALVKGGMEKEEAEKNAPIMKEAQAMLVKWEQGDPEVRELWKKMNSWVYAGFDKTYSDLGISFDKIYYESQTYLLGKALVQKGLDMGIFERQEDGSVWCDLTSDGLDRKLLLRGDGTSVYMTQDLGTAERRFDEYKLDELIYVVGNEQNYHFQVLKLILGKLGFGWSDDIYHLSYGMVELPEGKMKSREGTVVDADDLIEKMYNTAKETSLELGKLDGMSEQEQDELFRMLSLGALKYFIIKVDPKKTMLFDPKESIDFNGNTGPFIQYTHARIKSILRKAADQGIDLGEALQSTELNPKEVRLVKILNSFPAKIAEAGLAHSPALVANYAYELAKDFNQYYHDTPILREEDDAKLRLRLKLISMIARVLVKAMDILGIRLPERM